MERHIKHKHSETNEDIILTTPGDMSAMVSFVEYETSRIRRERLWTFGIATVVALIEAVVAIIIAVVSVG